MPQSRSFLSWFFTSLDWPVFAWVLEAGAVVVVAVSAYFLYRILLTPLVDHGEWHPANLRRFCWFLFLSLAAVATAAVLHDWMRAAAYWTLLALIAVVAIVTFMTRKHAY